MCSSVNGEKGGERRFGISLNLIIRPATKQTRKTCVVFIYIEVPGKKKIL